MSQGLAFGRPSASVVHDGHGATWSITAGVRVDATYRGILLNARGLTSESICWGASIDSMEVNNAW